MIEDSYYVICTFECTLHKGWISPLHFVSIYSRCWNLNYCHVTHCLSTPFLLLLDDSLFKACAFTCTARVLACVLACVLALWINLVECMHLPCKHFCEERSFWPCLHTLYILSWPPVAGCGDQHAATKRIADNVDPACLLIIETSISAAVVIDSYWSLVCGSP